MTKPRVGGVGLIHFAVKSGYHMERG
jgi:hypothetical protein